MLTHKNDFMCITGIPHKLSERGTYYEMITDSDEYRRYKEGADKQLALWLEGTSTVNQWHDNPDFWESCPDLGESGEPVWPLEQRQLFVNSGPEVREQMCMMVLSGVIQSLDIAKDVYVAGNVSTETVN